MKRKKIKFDIEKDILIKSRRRCCLCFGLEGNHKIQDGHIAHLDKNPNNNEDDNLAFLCLRHHNEYDSVKRLSKNLKIDEIKEYRKQLYDYNNKYFDVFETWEVLYFAIKEVAVREILRHLVEMKYSENRPAVLRKMLDDMVKIGLLRKSKSGNYIVTEENDSRMNVKT